MNIISKEHAARRLRSAIDEAGSLTAFCTQHNLNRGHISRMVNGHHHITDTVAKIIGLRMTHRYIEIA